MKFNLDRYVEDEVQGETATLAALGTAAAAAVIGSSIFGWDAFFRGAVGVVKAVVMGDEGNEGVAIVVLGFAAAATAVYRMVGGKRRRRRRQGNMTVARASGDRR